MEVAEILTATEWETERAQLVSERDEARKALSEFEEAAAIALQRQIETAVKRIRLEFADTEEAAGIALERQVAGAVERIRTEQAAECESLRAECLKLTAELDEANQLLAEMKEAKALLAQDPTAVEAAIRMETARVEVLMQELSATIDNAETELSEVIRMTFERSQQEAYIKGLRFSANLPT